MFDAGTRASAGLEIIAETGNTQLLSDEFQTAAARLDTTVGGGPIGPGAVVTDQIENINPAAYRYLSFASMIIPSNDAFLGNGNPLAYELFDAAGNFTGPVTIEIRASDIYDSGTEVNNASGAAGFSLGFDGSGSGPSTDDPNGVVAIHPDRLQNLVGINTAAGTVIGSNGGGFLEGDELIARITVTLAPVNTVDLEGVPAGTCRVYGFSYASELDTTAIGANVSTLTASECLDLSDNSVAIVREAPDGGELTGGPYSFCVGDGTPDNVSGVSLAGNSGPNSAWVVTDEAGMILGLPPTPEAVDFDGAGLGVCLIWHLSFADGLTGAEVGNNAMTDLVGCYDLSNPVTVNRMDCGDDGGAGDVTVDFKLKRFGNYVKVAWTVTGDIDALAYRLFRSEGVDGEKHPVSRRFFIAREGKTYKDFDRLPTPDTVYWIQRLDESLTETLLGPFTPPTVTSTIYRGTQFVHPLVVPFSFAAESDRVLIYPLDRDVELSVADDVRVHLLKGRHGTQAAYLLGVTLGDEITGE